MALSMAMSIMLKNMESLNTVNIQKMLYDNNDTRKTTENNCNGKGGIINTLIMNV